MSEASNLSSNAGRLLRAVLPGNLPTYPSNPLKGVVFSRHVDEPHFRWCSVYDSQA